MHSISIFILISCYVGLSLEIYFNQITYLSSNLNYLNSYCSNSKNTKIYLQISPSNQTFTSNNGINFTQLSSIPTTIGSQLMKSYNGSIYIMLGSHSLYVYNEQYLSNSSNNYYSFPDIILDFDFLNSTNINIQSYKLVYILQNTVGFQTIPFLDTSTVNVYTYNENLQQIKCLKQIVSPYCFIRAQSRLIILNTNTPTIYNYLDMNSNEKLTAFNYRINSTSEQVFIYLGLNTGLVRQYLFQSGALTIKRQSKNMMGYSILSILPHFNGNLMYIFSNQSSFVNIITSTGYMHESMNFSFMQNFSLNFDVKAKEISNTSILVFHPKSASNIFNANTNFTLSNSLAQSGLQIACPEGLFYNLSSTYCQTCPKGCQTCQKYTGKCFTCISGYFLYSTQCKSCVFDDLSTDYTNQCFTATKLSLFQATQSITPAVVSGVVLIYGVFSGSSLIFIFYRLFNFWSLVSLYYFLPMEIPFLLSKLLQKIFEVYYSSIFQLFGIQININFNIKQQTTNQKLANASISTDFLKSNTDNLIVFGYSVLLICTIFKAFKYLVKKHYKVQILQEVSLQACLQQFVGIFITFLIPLPFLLKFPYFFSFNQKINFGIQILVLGFILIFPFLYLAAIHKPSIKNIECKTKKILKNNQKKQQKHEIKSHQIILKQKSQSSQILKKAKSKKANVSIFSQKQGERFIYTIVSLATPFFVTIQPIQIFLFGGLLLHYFSVQNSLKAKKWRINLFIHKTTFMLYHSTYVLMYYTTQQDTKFFIAALSFFFILFGGLHELLTAIAEKIYFIYKVAKKLRNNKVQNSHNQRENKQKVNLEKLQHKKSKKQIEENQKQKFKINSKSVKIIDHFNSKRKIENDNLIFKTLKQIKENQNSSEIQQIKEQKLQQCKQSQNNKNCSSLEQNQFDNMNKTHKKSLFQQINPFNKQNKVESEASKTNIKFKPILITRKYIPDHQINSKNQQQPNINSKKTIQEKLKLKWVKYVVNTLEKSQYDDDFKQNQVDQKKRNNKMNKTSKQIKVNKQDKQKKMKQKLINRTAHNL